MKIIPIVIAFSTLALCAAPAFGDGLLDAVIGNDIASVKKQVELLDRDFADQP